MRRRSIALVALAVLFLLIPVLAEEESSRPEAKPSTSQPEAQTSAEASPAPAAPPGWFGRSIPLIIPPFVDQFPGIDLSKLSASLRERFLQRANTDQCTCGQAGCPRHTLAYCNRVDPECPRAKGLLIKLARDLIAPAASPSAPGSSTTPPPQAPKPGR